MSVVVEDDPLVLPRGTLIGGRYELRALIGEGGMGAVYLAEDRAIGRRVALKTLTLPGSKAEARFRREAQAASRLSSRYVAAVHDFGPPADRRERRRRSVLGCHASWTMLARCSIPRSFDAASDVY